MSRSSGLHDVYRAALETGLASAGLVTLQALAFPDDPGFLAPRLDPFLGLVVVQALRYGRGTSLLATAMAAGAQVYAVTSHVGGLAAMPLALQERLAAAALAHLVATLVVGEVGARLARALDRSRHRRRQLEGEVRELERRVAGLGIAREELAERLENQPVALSSFYKAARRLHSLERAQVEGTLLELVEELTDSRRTSLWRVDETGERLALVSRRGESRDAGPTELQLANELAGLAHRRTQAILVADLDPEDEAHLIAHAELRAQAAAPVDVRGGRDLVVVSEDLPFLRHTSATRTTLALLAELAGLMLSTVGELERRVGGPVEIGRQAALMEALGLALDGPAPLTLAIYTLHERVARGQLAPGDAELHAVMDALLADGAGPGSRVFRTSPRERVVIFQAGGPEAAATQAARLRARLDAAPEPWLDTADLVMGLRERARGEDVLPGALLREARQQGRERALAERLEAPLPNWNPRLGPGLGPEATEDASSPREPGS